MRNIATVLASAAAVLSFGIATPSFAAETDAARDARMDAAMQDFKSAKPAETTSSGMSMNHGKTNHTMHSTHATHAKHMKHASAMNHTKHAKSVAMAKPAK